MPEQTKIEPLSATELEVDFSKINFDSLPTLENNDNRKYQIITGTLPVELIKS